MSNYFIGLRGWRLGMLCFAACGMLAPCAFAQDAAPAITKQAVADFDKALTSAMEEKSEARQRLSVRRVMRDAEQLIETHQNNPSRFLALEFLFRAGQQLIALDKDPKHRQALLETCRELMKAPDDLADLRLEADLLLSQADLAKQGANAEARAQALRPFVERYIDTPVGPKVLRIAMTMALELGDNRLVTDLQEMIEERFAGDLEMIAFQRDKLGGQVIGAPFSGTFERSDGKMLRLPMDVLGRSTMLLFWSTENGGENLLKGIAAAALEKKEDLDGRLEFMSINLDELPDAGESFIRGLGVNWQVLRLPGGKKNPIYDAFVRADPRILTMSPTGYTALVMSGTTKNKGQSDGTPDYSRMFGSTLARPWTEQRYVAHLSSLMSGEFLVLDPEGGLKDTIDPTVPPELKALAMGKPATPLTRDAASVPEETLHAIQQCFLMPPIRYRLAHAEIRANYTKAADLCSKAIADHPGAPDLWIVRNRLITALLGLWKTDADLKPFEAAVTEAKAALEAGFPKGCDLIARFCLARVALRDPTVNPGEIIDRLIADNGGDSASGPVFAAAALLALDVADRARFQKYRATILKSHTEYPMMWTFSAFLLDRHHDYWLFQVPFTAGWSYGRREGYAMSKGDTEQAHRILRTELRAPGNKAMRIPEDLDSNWTIIFFSQPPPWQSKRDDGLPASPERNIQSLNEFAASRPAGDLKVMLATFGGDAESIRAQLLASKKPLDIPVVTIPGGVANPLVHRLGMLSEDNQFNSVLIHKDGRIALALSGLIRQGNTGGGTLGNVICREDEKSVRTALERGEIQAAKDKILALAPPFDPTAVDARGKKLRTPTYNIAHLRARARVYVALKEWDKALADAEEVVQRQLGTDGGMSLRTDELDESEALRNSILELLQKSKK